jgi:hypothetical protein
LCLMALYSPIALYHISTRVLWTYGIQLWGFLTTINLLWFLPRFSSLLHVIDWYVEAEF